MLCILAEEYRSWKCSLVLIHWRIVSDSHDTSHAICDATVLTAESGAHSTVVG